MTYADWEAEEKQRFQRSNCKVVNLKNVLICLSLLKLRGLFSFKIPRFLKILEPLFNEYSKNSNNKYALNLNIRVSFLNENFVGIGVSKSSKNSTHISKI